MPTDMEQRTMSKIVAPGADLLKNQEAARAAIRQAAPKRYRFVKTQLPLNTFVVGGVRYDWYRPTTIGGKKAYGTFETDDPVVAQFLRGLTEVPCHCIFETTPPEVK